MPSIVALLPAYNEEVSIGSVVLRTRQYADRVVVIDDGSRDRTAEVAGLAGKEAKNREEQLSEHLIILTSLCHRAAIFQACPALRAPSPTARFTAQSPRQV